MWYTESENFTRLLTRWKAMQALMREEPTLTAIDPHYRNIGSAVALWAARTPTGQDYTIPATITPGILTVEYDITCPHCHTIHHCQSDATAQAMETLWRRFTTCPACATRFHILSSLTAPAPAPQPPAKAACPASRTPRG